MSPDSKQGKPIRTSFTRHSWAEEIYRRATVGAGLLDLINTFGPNPISALANTEPVLQSFLNFCLTKWSQAYGQARQDLFVAWLLQEKRGGVFVEFGAADGVTNSNSLMLEQQYAWSGILIEPDPLQFALLSKNRPHCHLIQAGVAPDDRESALFVQVGQFSTLAGYQDRDAHSKARSVGTNLEVRLVQLNTVLAERGLAGTGVDYLSVDTEGSEVDILQRFDFAAFPVKILTVEHNNRPEDIRRLDQLLAEKGFVRMFEAFVTDIDSWYVARPLYAEMVESGRIL